MIEGGFAEDDGRGICQLKPSWQIQKISRGESENVNPIGQTGVIIGLGLSHHDDVTKNKCSPLRSGFYLHDSTKGFSHGCIKVEGLFFHLLRTYLKSGKSKKLHLKISYTRGVGTLK